MDFPACGRDREGAKPRRKREEKSAGVALSRSLDVVRLDRNTGLWPVQEMLKNQVL
jgi:hypothetical protein